MEGVARTPESGLDQSVYGLQRDRIGGGCCCCMDAGVVARDRWFWRLCDSSVVGAPMSVVDGRCAGVFEEVHPVVILNFG